MTAHDGAPNPDRMDVRERRELISAYLDGELPAEHALVVSAWLDAHPDALREVEHLRHLWDLLDHYEDEPVPEGFARGVVAAVGIEHAATGAGRVLSLGRFRHLLTTAAAMLVAVGATVFVMSDGGGRALPEAVPSAHMRTLDAVPAEYLEDVDLLVGLDDETFAAFLEVEDLDDAERGG